MCCLRMMFTSMITHRNTRKRMLKFQPKDSNKVSWLKVSYSMNELSAAVIRLATMPQRRLETSVMTVQGIR